MIKRFVVAAVAVASPPPPPLAPFVVPEFDDAADDFAADLGAPGLPPLDGAARPGDGADGAPARRRRRRRRRGGSRPTGGAPADAS